MTDIRERIDLLTGKAVEEVPPLSRDELEKFIRIALTGKSLDEFVRLLTNDFEEVIEYHELQRGGKTCQRMSLLYNPQRLVTRTATSKLSVFEALNTKSFISGLGRASVFQYGKIRDLLYTIIQLGVNGVQYVNEFPPHVARDLYREFDLNRNSQILDPCAGWGGRMIGASVVSDHYHGYEPASDTYDGLVRLSARLAQYRDTFEGKVTCKPFEDARLRPEFYDFALTSPPYYDTEVYSDEETNSLNRYPDFDSWCEGFYYPLIDKTMAALKPSGAFVINIGSRRYPLADRLREHAHTQGYTVERLKGSRIMGKSGIRNPGNEGEAFYVIRRGK